MVLRKPVAASAAVLAALAITVPAVSASAATTAPAVRTTAIGVHGHHAVVRHGYRGIGAAFDPGTLFCPFLVTQLQVAALSGNIPLANTIGYALLYLCPNPAI